MLYLLLIMLDEQNNFQEEQNVIENKTFEKVSSFRNETTTTGSFGINSGKTRTTFNNAEMNYDLGMQRNFASTNPNLWGKW